jgi:predicted transcriptional regulator
MVDTWPLLLYPPMRENTNEATAMTTNPLLSDELLHKVEDLAREQHRAPAEVIEEAVNRYAAECRLDRLHAKLGARAKKLGIREIDVPELVHQVREENRRGR